MHRSLLTPLVGLLALSSPLPFAHAEDAEPATADARAAETPAPLAEIDEHVVVYRNEGEYTPFPNLYQLPDDTLITQFSGRGSRRHIDTINQKVHRLRSTDGGKTWSAISKSDPLPPLPAWEVAPDNWVRVRDEGWIHVDISRQAELEAGGYRFRKVNDTTLAHQSPYILVNRSTDQGATWSEERFRAPDYVVGLYHHFSAHTSLKTSDGTLIRVLYGTSKGHSKQEVFIVRSEDQGKTWQVHRVQPEGSGEMGFNESAIIETADKRLLLVMRPDPEGYLWQTFSDDGGKTWSEPVSTGVIGHPPHLLKLDDGRLVLSYGYRRRPLGVRASISDDNGKSWKVAQEIVLRKDGEHRPADVGYPTTVVLKDGSFFTIYYITLEDNVTHIAGTKWRLAPHR